ncbi:hypothetical protein [Sphingomonas oryzagri]
MPSRPFKVIGVIRDERTDKLFDGRAIESATVARIVRAHDGDAALLRHVAITPAGDMPGGNGGVLGSRSFSDQRPAIINDVSTILAVIRYTGG